RRARPRGKWRRVRVLQDRYVRRRGEAFLAAGGNRDQTRQKLLAGDLRPDVDRDRQRVRIVGRVQQQVGYQDRRRSMIGDVVLDGDVDVWAQRVAVNLVVDADVVFSPDDPARLARVDRLGGRASREDEEEKCEGSAFHVASSGYGRERNMLLAKL